MLAIRELPLDSQPEYRLLKTLGYGSLSNYELLQLVYSFKSLETPQQLAAQAGSLRNLATMSLEEMQTIEGIGPKAALAIKAALDIGRRMAVEEREDESSLRSPDDFFKRLSYLQWMEQEHMVVVLLNSKLKVIAIETPHVGTVDSCQVRISEMFKMAVRRNATQVLLAHNHPSGDPELALKTLQSPLRPLKPASYSISRCWITSSSVITAMSVCVRGRFAPYLS